MTLHSLLQIATEFRARAAAAVLEDERRELLYLAEEYEAVACAEFPDRMAPFSVNLPK